jgi:lysophospholipase
MNDLPGPLDPTRTTTIPAPGGGLYGEVFLPKGTPRGVVLLTHGYAEHCGRYHEVAHVIVNASWAVLAYDVRGHGQSPGARGFIDRFGIYIDDLCAAAETAKQLAPNAPLVLLGHSHGALITLRALADRGVADACHAIISSPYLELQLKVPAWKTLLARAASRLVPGFDQPSGLRADQLMKDPQKQAEWAADKHNFPTANARWYTEALDAQRYVAEHADKIRVPTTWFVGGADPICVPATSKRIAARAHKAAYHELAGLRHEVFNETERGNVFAELTKVLAACEAPGASKSA